MKDEGSRDFILHPSSFILMKDHWLLDPTITYLNHGSFGATPIAVLAKQDEYRTQLEREPVRFMVRELEALLARSSPRSSAPTRKASHSYRMPRPA